MWISDTEWCDDKSVLHGYDFAVHYCASRGFKGKVGDPLPALMDDRVYAAINYCPDAFEQDVKDWAYQLACQQTLDRSKALLPIDGGSKL